MSDQPPQRRTLGAALRRLHLFLYTGSLSLQIVCGRHGEAYGITKLQKAKLVLSVLGNRLRIPETEVGTLLEEQLYLALRILQVPPDVKGDVAEFGCFHGASSAVISRVCALTGRKLTIFDSFGGLPNPGDEQIQHMVRQWTGAYHEGQYRSTFDHVRDTIQKYGNLSVCRFVAGFYEDTLTSRNEDEQFVVVFEDADLIASIRPILKYVWPRLQPGGVFLTHEAFDLPVAQLFFDDAWWRQEVGCPAPGLVGTGLGLPLTPWGSLLGFTVKPGSAKPDQGRRTA